MKTLTNNIMLRINSKLFEDIEREAERYNVRKTKFIRSILYLALDSISLDVKNKEKHENRDKLKKYLMYTDSRELPVLYDVSKKEVMDFDIEKIEA